MYTTFRKTVNILVALMLCVLLFDLEVLITKKLGVATKTAADIFVCAYFGDVTRDDRVLDLTETVERVRASTCIPYGMRRRFCLRNKPSGREEKSPWSANARQSPLKASAGKNALNAYANTSSPQKRKSGWLTRQIIEYLRMSTRAWQRRQGSLLHVPSWLVQNGRGQNGKNFCSLEGSSGTLRRRIPSESVVRWMAVVRWGLSRYVCAEANFSRKCVRTVGTLWMVLQGRWIRPLPQRCSASRNHR